MRALLALLLSTIVLGGCAKFPKSGLSNDFTRLHFEFSVAGTANPHYFYYVMFRPILGDTQDPNLNGPVPVIGSGSSNGFISGYPTRFVEYNADGGVYGLFRFLNKTEGPTNGSQYNDYDPNNPVNLAAYQNITGPSGLFQATAVDPDVAKGGDGRTFKFDLSTEDLVDDSDDAKKIVAIQFNIVSMNYPLTAGTSTGNHEVDYLGPLQNTTGYVQRPIIGSGQYSNGDLINTIPEGTNDVYGSSTTFPDIDIDNWLLKYQAP